MTTLYDKERYVLHCRDLKLYTRFELKVKSVEFRNSPNLLGKNHISISVLKDAHKHEIVVKYFFKLMKNAVYGKSLENVCNRIDFQLTTNERKLDKVIAKPRVKAWYIYNTDFVGVTLKKTEIFLNRPIYIDLPYWILAK